MPTTASALISITNRAFVALVAPTKGVGIVEDVINATLTDGNVPSTKIDFAMGRTVGVPPAGNVDLDLRTEPMPDRNPFQPTKITYICVRAESNNAASVVVKPGAANGLAIFGDPSDTFSLNPGGFLICRWPTGVTCDATHKVINFADAGAAGGTVTISAWGV